MTANNLFEKHSAQKYFPFLPEWYIGLGKKAKPLYLECEELLFKRHADIKSYCYCWLDDSNIEIPITISSKQGRKHDLHESTSSDLGNSLLSAIEEAAAKENRETFSLIVKKVDWSMRQPYELVRTIDLSLSLDMVPLAMELVSMAKRIFPSDKKIEVLARIISPPRAIGTRPSQSIGIDKSKKWIKQNSFKYKGKWIAVQNGELLGDAPTLKELHNQIGQHKNTPNTIIVKVLS
jgi:hypothetical protein